MRWPALAAAALSICMSMPAAAAPAPGPVAGTRDLKVVVAASKQHCHGTRYAVTKASGAASDKVFVAAMTVAFPTGLDFDPQKPERAQASTKRFAAWMNESMRRMEAAQRFYERIIADDQHSTPRDRVIAAARVAQFTRHFADVFATAEIPASLRRGPDAADITAAFCDKLDEQAAALTAKGDEAAAACAKFAAQAQVGAGWWDAVCVPMAAPAPPPAPAPPASPAKPGPAGPAPSAPTAPSGPPRPGPAAPAHP